MSAARKCARCGQGYSRRNMTEVWDKQNPGHRDGWHKRIEKICTHCQNAENAKQILKVFHQEHVPAAKRRIEPA